MNLQRTLLLKCIACGHLCGQAAVLRVRGKASMCPCGDEFLSAFNRKISEGATAMQGPCLRNTDYGTVSILNMKFSV